MRARAALGRRGFIRPTYWEVPMPQSNNPRLPPDELAKLHFHGFSEEVNDEDFASTRSPAIPLSDYEEWARRRAVEGAQPPECAESIHRAGGRLAPRECAECVRRAGRRLARRECAESIRRAAESFAPRG